jgi:hypothetical protein
MQVMAAGDDDVVDCAPAVHLLDLSGSLPSSVLHPASNNIKNTNSQGTCWDSRIVYSVSGPTCKKLWGFDFPSPGENTFVGIRYFH